MRHFVRDAAPLLAFLVEIEQSRSCCDEWCATGGLFAQLHQQHELCPYDHGSNRSPQRTVLRFESCTAWCSRPRGVYNVLWQRCASPL